MENLMAEYGELQLRREAIIAQLEQVNREMAQKKMEMAKKKNEDNEVPE